MTAALSEGSRDSIAAEVKEICRIAGGAALWRTDVEEGRWAHSMAETDGIAGWMAA